MPQVKLVFDLEKKEDVIYYNRANKASDMSNALYEIALLTDKIKFHLERTKASDDVNQGALLVLEEVNKLIQKYEINFNSLFAFEEKQKEVIVEKVDDQQVVSLKKAKVIKEK